jgi:hypothetical protein
VAVGHQSLVAAPKSEEKKPAAEKRTVKKPVVAPDGPRMPALYGKVVDDEQRTKILAIQKKYAPKIEQKRAELQALLDERETAFQELLTPAQKRQLEELRAEARAKREATAANTAEEKEAAEEDSKPAKESK